MNTYRRTPQQNSWFMPGNLMLYLICLYVVGMVILYTNPTLYLQYLALNPGAILRGQVWRLFTFLMYPPSTNILWFLLVSFIYYSLARALASIIGLKKFNLFLLIGIGACIAGAFICYAVWGDLVVDGSAINIYNSMLLALAVAIPDAQFRLYFIIPIKASWLGIFYGALLLYQFIRSSAPARVMLVMSLVNFAIFFFWIRNPAQMVRQAKRKADFRKSARSGQAQGPSGGGTGAGWSSGRQAGAGFGGYAAGTAGRGTAAKSPIQQLGQPRHRCAVCGRTDLDDPNLEFRYCSKCEGIYEYCMDHLYTHKHVTSDQQ